MSLLAGAWQDLVRFAHALRCRLLGRGRRAEMARLTSEGDARFDAGEWNKAASCYERALGFAAHDSVEFTKLSTQLGLSLERMGRAVDAEAVYAEAQLSGSPGREQTVLTALQRGALLGHMNRWSEAASVLQCAREWAQTGGWTNVGRQIRQLLIRASQLTGNHEQALALLLEALAEETSPWDPVMYSVLLDIAGDVVQAMETDDSALRYYERSLDQFMRLGDSAGQWMVQRDIASFLEARGKWTDARAWLMACLHYHRERGDPASEASTCFELGCLDAYADRFGEAVAWLNASMVRFREASDRSGVDRVGRALLGLGVVVQQAAAADRMTFRDIERGSMRMQDGEEDS